MNFTLSLPWTLVWWKKTNKKETIKYRNRFFLLGWVVNLKKTKQNNDICLFTSYVSLYVYYLTYIDVTFYTGLTCSMWLTSKMEQCSLVCMCETIWLSLYWTGILQPANSTIFPPCSLWKSNSGVLFKAAWGKWNITLSVKDNRKNYSGTIQHNNLLYLAVLIVMNGRW